MQTPNPKRKPKPLPKPSTMVLLAMRRIRFHRKGRGQAGDWGHGQDLPRILVPKPLDLGPCRHSDRSSAGTEDISAKGSHSPTTRYSASPACLQIECGATGDRPRVCTECELLGHAYQAMTFAGWCVYRTRYLWSPQILLYAYYIYIYVFMYACMYT